MFKFARDVATADYMRRLEDFRRRESQNGPNISHEENVAGTRAVTYNCVAALAFLVYDMALTTSQEVRVIWPIPWNWTKILYFFVRYFPVILLSSTLFVGTPPFVFTKHECYIWNVYQALASILIIGAVDYILVLRVFALYPRSKPVRYFVGVLYLSELVTLSVGIGMSVPLLEVDDLCTVVGAPTVFLVSAGAPIVFQASLFVLTAWKFYEAVRAGWGDVPLVMLLMRDGTWAFVVLFVLLLGEAALYGFAPDAYTDVLYGWINGAFSLCGYRVVLNLHSLRQRAQDTAAESTAPDIQFTSNVLSGPYADHSHPITALSRSNLDIG